MAALRELIRRALNALWFTGRAVGVLRLKQRGSVQRPKLFRLFQIENRLTEGGLLEGNTYKNGNTVGLSPQAASLSTKSFKHGSRRFDNSGRERAD